MLTPVNQRQLTAAELCARCRPLVIAHRGASRQAPENTLPAFAAALSLGVDLIEFDYQAAADGTPVVIHDADLDRTTNARDILGCGPLKVADSTWPELARLDAGSWFSPAFRGTPLPSLADALAAIVPGAVALVERKSGDAATLCRWLEATNLTERVAVQSFDWQFLADCRRFVPQLTLAVLGEKALTSGRLDAAMDLGASAVAWHDANTDAGSIAAIHARGLKAWVWTVDDPARQRQLLAWGVDGVITNDPAGLLRELGPG
jgi:glycerophosphoryl diester phosphodiesterase